ncbi:MAG: hypothetical protein ACI8ZM_000713 [Crocinitomix sp.]|jgi:hypothetical protein
MSKTREEYVNICKVCTNRGFDMNKGQICRITKEHAAYLEPECPDFDLDAVAADKKAVADALRKEDDAHNSTLGLSKFGINNQMIAGIIVIILSLTWLIWGLYNNLIFFYPIIILIIGIVFTIRGAILESKKIKAKKDTTSSEVLDDSLT